MLAYLLGVSARRRLHVPVPLAVLAAVLWLSAAARADTPPAFTSTPPVAVQGNAVVGSTLTAVATWSPGDPVATVTYAWGRCPADSNICPAIPGATSQTYVVTPADVGSRLAARIDLTNTATTPQPVYQNSAATPVVVVPSAPPAPPPPPPAPPPAPPAPVKVVAASSAPPSASFLDPFPVVRIRGFFRRTGAQITLLSVRGPKKAKVTARCVGHGCPVKSLTSPSANVRLHGLERFLHAGIQLQIRVTRPGRIGSYTSFLIRSRKAPLRTDRCLTSHGKPVVCSAP
jgi:predicted actin-binding protein